MPDPFLIGNDITMSDEIERTDLWLFGSLLLR